MHGRMTLGPAGDGNQPVVALPAPLALSLLLGLENADEPGEHHTAGMDRRVEQDNRVERVAVLGEGFRYEAEVEREGHARRQDPVEAIYAQLVIEFQLVARTTRRLDDDHDQAVLTHWQLDRRDHRPQL